MYTLICIPGEFGKTFTKWYILDLTDKVVTDENGSPMGFSTQAQAVAKCRELNG